MSRKWCIHSVTKEAKKYKHREEFYFGSRGAYNWAVNNKKMKIVCSHMSYLKKSRTFNEVKSIAKKFEYKKDFIEQEYRLYRYASSKGWVPKIMSHMKSNYHSPKDQISWTRAKVLAVMKKSRTRKEFRKKFSGAKAWAERNHCLEKLFEESGLISKNKSYTKSDIIKEAKKYTSRNEFKLNSTGYYSSAQNKGILDEVCSHMDILCVKWTIKKAEKVLSKYDNMKSIRDKEKGLYFWLLDLKKNNRKKFFSMVKHLNYKENIKYSDEEIKLIAKQYKCIRDFYYYDRKAYTQSRKRSKAFHKKTVSHMQKMQDLREKRYQVKFVRKLKAYLKKKEIDFKIKEEYLLPRADIKERGFLDVYLDLGFVRIPIELKHDESFWLKKDLINQKRKYNRKLRKRKNIIPVKVVSPKGKYGMSEKDFFNWLVEYV